MNIIQKLKEYELKLENFNYEQMQEIRQGLKQGVDVSIYANPKFDDDQMRQIRKGLEKELDVSIYANPEFNWEQMEQIRLDLENQKLQEDYEPNI